MCWVKNNAVICAALPRGWLPSLMFYPRQMPSIASLLCWRYHEVTILTRCCQDVLCWFPGPPTPFFFGFSVSYIFLYFYFIFLHCQVLNLVLRTEKVLHLIVTSVETFSLSDFVQVRICKIVSISFLEGPVWYFENACLINLASFSGHCSRLLLELGRDWSSLCSSTQELVATSLSSSSCWNERSDCLEWTLWRYFIRW